MQRETSGVKYYSTHAHHSSPVLRGTSRVKRFNMGISEWIWCWTLIESLALMYTVSSATAAPFKRSRWIKSSFWANRIGIKTNIQTCYISYDDVAIHLWVRIQNKKQCLSFTFMFFSLHMHKIQVHESTPRTLNKQEILRTSTSFDCCNASCWNEPRPTFCQQSDNCEPNIFSMTDLSTHHKNCIEKR